VEGADGDRVVQDGRMTDEIPRPQTSHGREQYDAQASHAGEQYDAQSRQGWRAPEIDGARHLHSGKVRDLYELDDGRLLMIASDRISAYDFVLTPTIPDKGILLNRMSLWWFAQLRHVVPNHVLSTDVPPEVAGRAVVCERLDMYPVECVARGYLAGSGLVDYRATGAVCGIELPGGLVDGSRLPEPIFTPATKAALGEHDENVSYDAIVQTVGQEAADRLRSLTLAVYGRAEALAQERGIILADTKFEFGRRDDTTIVLADEVLTPDSSRFWPADRWEPGHPQPSYDKQFVRDWLTSPETGWDRASGEPPPALPERIVEQTRATYVEAYERLTGERF
jgi:phosphoribosylaminoimidazole-succinocarboxamide synthase